MSGTYIEIKFPFVECESPHRYWTFGESDPKWENLEYDEAKEVLKKLLKKSVTRQMVTDVPYGAFLSGGIDSTLITAVMQSISDKPVNTFTIGFEESNFNEAKYAKEIARFLGTNYTEYYFTRKELLEYIPKMSMIYDEPLADISQLAMCLLSDTAKKRVTVCLSGDCGDELFLGYGNYKKLPDIRKKYPSILGKPLGTMVSGLKFIDSRFETKGRKLKNDLKKDIWESFGASVYWNKCMNLSVKNNNLYDIRRELIADKSFVDQLAVWDFYTEMSDMILTKVDRAAMSCSLETRVPFLDKDIIGFVNSIPTEYKIKEKNQKRILKDILEEYVPRRLFERPKQGFAVPMHSFFRNELKEWADSYIYSEKMYQSLEFINKTLLQKQWEIFQKNDKRTGMFEFWRFFILAQWIESVNKM
jgi:asparagine synthase (glutamine-hydrolysing)